MRTKLLMLAISAVVFTASTACGQTATVDPVRLAAARDVLVATHADELLGKSTEQMSDSMFDGMRKQMLANASASDPYSGERIRRAMAIVKSETSRVMIDMRPQLIDMSANIYAREFTVDELKAIAAFYRSPVGRSFVAKLPLVMRDLGQVMGSTMIPQIAKRMEALKPKIDAAMADLPPVKK